mgnify:CR=1 FL=1
MRPTLVLWMVEHGLPGWIVPTYFILVGLSGLVACMIVMRIARSDGADLFWQSRALLVTYLSALAGGYIVESLRMVPVAIVTGSLGPIFSAGRSAYGGLLTALLCATLYLRHNGQSVSAFLDRVAVGAGVVFCFVRTGCFLAGCDYGQPTAGPGGLRFPPGSLAAVEHAQRGWVPMGFPSLPVHPTQLYEASLGLIAAAAAALVLRRRPRDGSAWLAFLTVYGCGRFVIELWRGDASRGLYLGMSTAQYISLAILGACAVLALRIRSVSAAPVQAVASQ